MAQLLHTYGKLLGTAQPASTIVRLRDRESGSHNLQLSSYRTPPPLNSILASHKFHKKKTYNPTHEKAFIAAKWGFEGKMGDRVLLIRDCPLCTPNDSLHTQTTTVFLPPSTINPPHKGKNGRPTNNRRGGGEPIPTKYKATWVTPCWKWHRMFRPSLTNLLPNPIVKCKVGKMQV